MKSTISPAEDADDTRRPTAIFVAARRDFSIEGLVRILSDNADNDVVACIEPSEHCWVKLRATGPDIVLLHHSAVLEPPGALFGRIREAAPQARIIVFGRDMDDAFLFDIVRAGASGYINENMTAGNLLHAISEARSGRLWVERRVLEATARAAIDLERTLENLIVENIRALGQDLGTRESAVFRAVLDGLTTKDMAERLHLSEQSVKLYLGRIFSKFGVTNRSQLILHVFSRICPVQDVYRLIATTLDRRGRNVPSPLHLKTERPASLEQTEE